MNKRKLTVGKFRHSLMARYLMLIGLAIFLLPIVLVLMLVLYLGYVYLIWQPTRSEINPKEYVLSSDLNEDWHTLAASLDGASAAEIVQALRTFRENNPLISVTAVDAAGQTIASEPVRNGIPEVWTPGGTAEYMKRATAYNSPTFAVLAFIGEGTDEMQDRNQGFIVAEVARAYTVSAMPDTNNRIPPIVGVFVFLILFVLFAFMSWAFFYRIRKRLIRLQIAMTEYDDAGIPMPVGSGKQKDEVAALEGTFNTMVHKLRDGREREQEEEELRKKLIANLSHDLRTPLTVIRSHAYSLESEPLGERGQESLKLMTRKLDDLGGLIDNLLSYTLIAAGRYPMRLEETDILRVVRTAAAQWYPVFEKEGMEVDADLPDEALLWVVDREWFVRILDNLFQNVVRHAKDGAYIGLSLGEAEEDGRRPLLIRDKGPGLNRIESDMQQVQGQQRRNPADGAGIGLSIVDLMIREMGMSWKIQSDEQGTIVVISTKN